MASLKDQKATHPLIVIVGQTASGKTAASIEIAEKFRGEIICADSRTVYRHMDIGTAKPTKAEQNMIPHHLIDVVEPNQGFSVAEFKRLSEKCIQEINDRGKVPIVVGGSGLYIDSLLYNFQFTERDNSSLRAELGSFNDEELTTYINNNNIDVTKVNTKNRRHLINYLARGATTPKNTSLRNDTIILGIKLDKEVLRRRIEQRVDEMFRFGFLDEVKVLANTYGWDNASMTGIGYKIARGYFSGQVTEQEVKDAFIRRDLSLAKRQRTWFKRNKNIRWFDSPSKLIDEAGKFIVSYSHSR